MAGATAPPRNRKRPHFTIFHGEAKRASGEELKDVLAVRTVTAGWPERALVPDAEIEVLLWQARRRIVRALPPVLTHRDARGKFPETRL
jgi:hypothetical protein